MHVLILGQTGTGKTTLATTLVRQYQAAFSPRLSMVLDPFADSRWQSEWVYRDLGAFMLDVKRARGMSLFIDESGSVVGQYERENHWLATEARHWGHRSHFIAQRAQQVAPTVRYQCSQLALFRVSHSDAAELSKDWSTEGIERAATLGRGEFLWIDRFGGLRPFRIDFASGTYRPLGKNLDTLKGKEHESADRATSRRAVSRDGSSPPDEKTDEQGSQPATAAQVAE